MYTRTHRLLFGGVLFLALPVTLLSQERYRDPSPVITRILDAPRTPQVVVSPNRTRLLLLEPSLLPPIAVVAAPELRLGGVRINPRNNALSRAQTYSALIASPIGGGEVRRIVIPWQARIGNAFWSPDGRRIAYTLIEDSGISLWIAEAAGGESRMVTGPVLNGVFGNPCAWLPSGSGLICARVPAGRPAPPPEPAVPTGPVVRESQGQATPNPTFEDLLQNPHDEALFEHYFTDQLVLIALDGPNRLIGAPGMHKNVEISPDGKYLLVETIQHPFSYLVPYQRFAARSEVWDVIGNLVAVVVEHGLQENSGRSSDAVQTGPRSISWRGDAPATLAWVQALDGGDPAAVAPFRDRIQLLAPPFTGQPTRLADLEYRARGITWGRENLAIVSEGWQRTRKTRRWLIDPSHPASAPKLLFEGSSENRYADPGQLLSQPGASGRPVLLTSKDGRFAFLAGAGASPAGDQPFLDRIELATGKMLRLWRSEAPYYEEVAEVLDPDAGRVLTRRESVSDPPNYFIRDLKKRGPAQLSQLTRFPDPAPAFAGVTQQLITYMRADGVHLSATLYLPAGYDKAQPPLPFLFWAYPREFLDAGAASQVIGSPYRFTRPSGASPLFLLLQGYGVLDGPTMPIIAKEGKEPNDTYVQQLVASAQAAVDKVVSMGVADPKRIGIGGHSYGAFMTANLLAHSQLFRAGIARSGAYNRTLTPFGFQNEERNYWEAEGVYAEMSPFNFADKIKEPILLIHGMADDNSGTFPIQSERMYAALVGLGGTVRLVMLPGEAHGYRARESVGHTLYEMVNWLDQYVKGSGSQVTP